MNFVGIDVSKAKSMIAVMRPLGEIVVTYEVCHTDSNLISLLDTAFPNVNRLFTSPLRDDGSENG